MTPLTTLEDLDLAMRDDPAPSLLEPLDRKLREILRANLLSPRFQPILDFRSGDVHGFEGLIRGPSDSPLHSPHTLFRVARYVGLQAELEAACLRTLLAGFAQSGQRCRLFLNVSPSSLVRALKTPLLQRSDLLEMGLSPGQVVIELTESEPTFAWEALLEAADHFRSAGFAIAMDDLGEGFSSLRLWSALRPDYVKVDKHFVQGVSFDPVKLQFLRSIHDLARRTGALTVAEGIETEADLATLHELGLEFGQGYHLGRPAPTPVAPARVRSASEPGPSRPLGSGGGNRATAGHLMRSVVPVCPETSILDVEKRFSQDGELQNLPVVNGHLPVGLLNRHAFQDVMARPFSRELYGKRPCEIFMERHPVVVDHHTTLHELSELLVASDPRHLLFGFVVTRGGSYVGLGSGAALMREITALQIRSARYANPLTLLPGNVPIHEHLDALLAAREPFVVAYADLDHFKPFNDVYGYRRGDEVIQWTARVLHGICDPAQDFLGHVGGDDFLLVLRGSGWQMRLEGALHTFEDGRGQFFSLEHIARGGYESEDRQGRSVLHPLLALSIGALTVQPGQFQSHHEVSAAATQTKRMAKRTQGCSLFIERRNTGESGPRPETFLSPAQDPLSFQ